MRPELLADLTNEQLMERYIATEDQALFNLLHQRYADVLLKFVYDRYFRDHGVAEDICQQTWLTVHLRKERYVTGTPFGKWLFTVAGNFCLKHARDTTVKKRGGGLDRKQVSIFQEDRSAPLGWRNGGQSWCNEPVAREEATDAALYQRRDELEVFDPKNGGERLLVKYETINVAIAALPEQRRQVIMLRKFEHLSERDTAERMNISRHELRRIEREALNELYNILSKKAQVA